MPNRFDIEPRRSWPTPLLRLLEQLLLGERHERRVLRVKVSHAHVHLVLVEAPCDGRLDDRLVLGDRLHEPVGARLHLALGQGQVAARGEQQQSDSGHHAVTDKRDLSPRRDGRWAMGGRWEGRGSAAASAKAMGRRACTRGYEARARAATKRAPGSGRQTRDIDAGHLDAKGPLGHHDLVRAVIPEVARVTLAPRGPLVGRGEVLRHVANAKALTLVRAVRLRHLEAVGVALGRGNAVAIRGAASGLGGREVGEAFVPIRQAHIAAHGDTGSGAAGAAEVSTAEVGALMLERPGGGSEVARVAAVEVVLLRPTAREKVARPPGGVSVATDTVGSGLRRRAAFHCRRATPRKEETTERNAPQHRGSVNRAQKLAVLYLRVVGRLRASCTPSPGRLTAGLVLGFGTTSCCGLSQMPHKVCQLSAPNARSSPIFDRAGQHTTGHVVWSAAVLAQRRRAAPSLCREARPAA
eukprot:scaffold102772_cov51-Phaeocystis_antarctica.AAC.1